MTARWPLSPTAPPTARPGPKRLWKLRQVPPSALLLLGSSSPPASKGLPQPFHSLSSRCSPRAPSLTLVHAVRILVHAGGAHTPSCNAGQARPREGEAQGARHGATRGEGARLGASPTTRYLAATRVARRFGGLDRFPRRCPADSAARPAAAILYADVEKALAASGADGAAGIAGTADGTPANGHPICPSAISAAATTIAGVAAGSSTATTAAAAAAASSTAHTATTLSLGRP